MAERYFLRVQARNKSSFHLEWKGFDSNHPNANAAVGSEMADLTENSTLPVDDLEISSNSSGLSNLVETQPGCHQVSSRTGVTDQEQQPVITVGTDTPVFTVVSNHPRLGVASKWRL